MTEVEKCNVARVYRSTDTGPRNKNSSNGELLGMDLMAFHREYGGVLSSREWRRMDRVFGRLYNAQIQRVPCIDRLNVEKYGSGERQLQKVGDLYHLSQRAVMHLAKCGPKSMALLNKMLRENSLPVVSPPESCD